MSSAPTDCRVPATPDPADKLDAKADGGFGNHRAGYSQDKLATAEYWARKGGTLNAGEGLILCAEIDRLRKERDAAEADAERRWAAIVAAAEKIYRLERILAALREPSGSVWKAAWTAVVDFNGDLRDGIIAAVETAEWEVGNE